MELAQLATGNIDILANMGIDEIRQYHPILDTTVLPFRKAIKTKGILARTMSSCFSDKFSVNAFRLRTLEGYQDIKWNAYLCKGINGEFWQQAGPKLMSSYEVDWKIDVNGWHQCLPKSDDIRNVCQITAELVKEQGLVVGPYGGFAIINPNYGDKRFIDGQAVYLHYGVLGDYVVQMPNNLLDTYRVFEKILEATYSFQ